MFFMCHRRIVLAAIACLSSALAAAGDVFDRLDVTEATRADYRWRVRALVDFIAAQGGEVATDSYLDFKRSLATRTGLSVATKNKYLGRCLHPPEGAGEGWRR